MKPLLIFVIALSSFSSCTKNQLQHDDNDTISPRTTSIISGNIVWEHDDITGVGNVTVTLSGPETAVTITDNFGNYSFSVNTSGNYTITPSKLINKTNGLNSLDAAAIQQHITLINPINDPYKRIAADANKNNTLSTLDASIITQASLGNPSALIYMNPSWKFVDASFALSLPPGYLSVPTGYPESRTVTIAGASVSGIDFVGIKRGDVNGSANPLN